MKHKRLLLLALSAVVSLGAGLGWYFIKNSPEAVQSDQNGQSNSDIAFQKFSDEQQSKVAKTAGGISSVEDLKTVAKEDRGEVGLYLAELSIQEGDTAKADAYLDYLMTVGDNYSLDASLRCYQYTKNDERRAYCLDNMNRLAIELGVIKQGEVLPKSYYASEEQ